MDREAFNIYVETQLAPTLRPGDIVILDNLSVHKSVRAEAAVRARGAWMLFLPQYSPDLNPIEMAFSKLKAHLRKIATRTFDALIAAIGDICRLYHPANVRTTSPRPDMFQINSTMLARRRHFAEMDKGEL